MFRADCHYIYHPKMAGGGMEYAWVKYNTQFVVPIKQKDKNIIRRRVKKRVKS